MLIPACLTLGASLAAQDIEILLQPGDPVPNGLTVSRVLGTTKITRQGSWSTAVRTSNPNPLEDELIIRDGVVLRQSGTPSLSAPFLVPDRFFSLDDVGTAVAFGANDLGAGDYVQLGDTLLALENHPFPAADAQLSGYLPVSVGSPVAADSEALFVQCRLRNTLTGQELNAAVRFRIDSSQQVIQSSIAIREGQALTGGGTVSGQLSLKTVTSGRLPVWTASGSIGQFAAIGSVPVAVTDNETPGFNHTWYRINDFDAVDRDHWAAIGRVLVIGGTTIPRTAIFSNCGLVHIDRAPHPAHPTGGEVYLGTFQGGVRIAATGEVLFRGDLGGIPDSSNTALILGDQIILREGDVLPNGAVVDELNAFDLSDDGAFALALVETVGTTGYSLIRITISPGSSYCNATPNSTDCIGHLNARGSNAIADNDLRLRAYGLPPNSFALIAVSRTSGYVPLAAGSQGNLCLGAEISRLLPVISAGASGVAEKTVDLTAILPPVGAVPFAPGDHLHFQAWYRDVNPQVTSNFTTAVSVLLR